MTLIASFSGEYRFLSNFYGSEVTLDGVRYSTVEHAFQAAKTHDAAERERIRIAPTPGSAKRHGRQVKLRPDWESVKVDVMRGLLWQKFGSEPLRSMLLATGDAELIEGNTWNDTFWGICRGRGKNWLGRILMGIRNDLRRV